MDERDLYDGRPAGEEAAAREAVERAVAEARQLREQGQWGKALAVLQQALPYGAGTAVLYFQMGNVYYDAGDLAQAEAAYRKCIEHDADHASAHHNLAVVCKRQGRIAESVALQRRAVRLELRKPGRVELTDEERASARRFLSKAVLVVGVGVLLLLAVASFFNS